MSTTLEQPPAGVNPTDKDGAAPEGTDAGENTKTGQLFEIKIDPTRPTVIKISFSGSIDLDLNQQADAAFYNSLVAGKNAVLEVEAHVAGAKKTHRRDSEGNVDAVVETKSLIIHSLDLS